MARGVLVPVLPRELLNIGWGQLLLLHGLVCELLGAILRHCLASEE